MSGLFAVCGSISADMIGYAPRLPGPGESVLGDRFLLAPGGKGANVAVAAARLGARVRFFGARGDDQFGEFIGGALADEGVDVSSLAVIAGMHSGVALIAVDAQGENQILALPGANGLAGAPEPCGAAVWFCPGEMPRAAQEGTRRGRARRRRHRGRQPVAANAIDPEVVAQLRHRDRQRDRAATRSPGICPRASCSRAARAGAVLLPRGHRAAGGARAARSTRPARAMRSRAPCAPASPRARRSSRRCSSRS